MDRPTMADKSLGELLELVESGALAANRAGSYSDLPHVIALKVAQAQEAAAKTTGHWARVAALASVASVCVAIAAVIVATLSGGWA